MNESPLLATIALSVLLLTPMAAAQASSWPQLTAGEEERPPLRTEDERRQCSADHNCGVGVGIDEYFGGVDNCSADAYCLTRRLYHYDSAASDYIMVPDWPGAGGSGEPGGPGGPGSGGAPSCIPRGAVRVAPSFEQVDLAQGSVGVNPRFEQLTGLESWLWWEGEAARSWSSPVAWGVAADCSIIAPPSPEIYEATLVELRWEVGDGRPASYVSSGPGSEEFPAVRHVYRTKGTWTVRVSCVWEGQWGETVTVPCGERTLETIEVRTRLTR